MEPTHTAFEGRCKEACEFYEKCLGSETTAMPGQDHARTTRPGRPGLDEPRLAPGDAVRRHQGHRDVAVHVETPAEAERPFAAMYAGGTVQMPSGETYNWVRFGMLTNRFSVTEMINCEKAAGA